MLYALCYALCSMLCSMLYAKRPFNKIELKFLTYIMSTINNNNMSGRITYKETREMGTQTEPQKKEKKAAPKKCPPVDSYPAPPEGWTGPFKEKYLWKIVKTADGKNSFYSFDEAIIAANSVSNCGGITKTSRGYSLRLGPDLITANPQKLSSALASWIKGEFETPIAEPTPEPVPEPVPESDSDSDSDSDDVDVDQIEIDGVEYYWDESTTILYTVGEENEIVGKYVKGEKSYTTYCQCETKCGEKDCPYQREGVDHDNE